MSKRAVKKTVKARQSRARVTVTVSIKPLIAGKLTALASSLGLSRSRYLEQLLEQSLESEEIGIKALTDPVMAKHLLSMFSNPEMLRHMAKLYGEQLRDDQLELFASRLQKLTGGGGDDVRKR